jgi:predicted dehydrogenase
MSEISRRRFAAWTALSYSRVQGANERIRLAGLGVGGRGSYLLSLAARAEAEIVAVCDVQEDRRAAAVKKLAPAARAYVDYREVLDRRDIDAVIIGSPDHWHVPLSADAVRAGKDVYVEKPLSHTIDEAEMLRGVVRASKQILQVGYQQRSWPHFLHAREEMPKLGRVTFVLTSWYQAYFRNLRGFQPPTDKGVDWERFLGNAPKQPFNGLRLRHWRWFWDFGGGHLTDLYSHYGDVIHWYMGQDTPLRVTAMGNNDAIPQFETPAAARRP